MALWHWNWMLAVDNSMTRHCRTNDRGQKTKDWAGRRFAFNSHHPLSFVFCPLSLKKLIAFADWSFGVLELLRRFEDFSKSPKLLNSHWRKQERFATGSYEAIAKPSVHDVARPPRPWSKGEGALATSGFCDWFL